MTTPQTHKQRIARQNANMPDALRNVMQDSTLNALLPTESELTDVERIEIADGASRILSDNDSISEEDAILSVVDSVLRSRASRAPALLAENAALREALRWCEAMMSQDPRASEAGNYRTVILQARAALASGAGKEAQ